MTSQTIADDQEYDALLDKCLAYAVTEGDIVNFRLLFMPASPFRPDSPEDASSAKYDYLFAESEDLSRFREALALVRSADMPGYVREQLAHKGPPRLPWQMILALGDNAVRLGKYTAAAQAYELLRIRRRMQDMTLDKADEWLAQGDISTAVRGYCIALGLQYDYSAFPEPLPAVPDYQERAPGLHSVYPASMEQTLALQDDDALCKIALSYLMPYSEFSDRFQRFPQNTVLPFTAALIRALDPNWEEFATDFKEAMQVTVLHESLLKRLNAYSVEVLEVLSEELVNVSLHQELKRITTILTRSSGEKGEWWEHIKTLAYHHPCAVLFVTRQRLSAKEEILIPRVREDSLLAQQIGLTP